MAGRTAPPHGRESGAWRPARRCRGHAARRRPSTATSRPTWRCKLARPCRRLRATSPRPSSKPSRAGHGNDLIAQGRGRRPRLSSTSGCSPATSSGPSTRSAPRVSTTAAARPTSPRGSTSSSSAPIPPARSPWATRAAPSSAICCAASLRRSATRSRASTTSTTRAARSSDSASRSWPWPQGEQVPEDGYHGDYVGRLAQELPARASRGRRKPTRRRQAG